jgi:hypothetical protein
VKRSDKSEVENCALNVRFRPIPVAAIQAATMGTVRVSRGESYTSRTGASMKSSMSCKASSRKILAFSVDGVSKACPEPS